MIMMVSKWINLMILSDVAKRGIFSFLVKYISLSKITIMINSKTWMPR